MMVNRIDDNDDYGIIITIWFPKDIHDIEIIRTNCI